jgi:hypothetical protein
MPNDWCFSLGTEADLLDQAACFLQGSGIAPTVGAVFECVFQLVEELEEVGHFRPQVTGSTE